VLERGFLSYRLRLPYDRSEKDAWFGYSPVGALRKLPFILYSRPAEDWLQRSGSSSTISPTTLFLEISARGRRNCSRSSTRRGSREYATTPASMPPLRHLSRKPPRYSGGSARHIEFGIPQMIYSRTSDRFRGNSPVAAHSGDRLLSEPTVATQPCRREPLFMPPEPTFALSSFIHALCDERAVRLMKDHLVDDRSFAAKFDEEALQFHNAEPSVHCVSPRLALRPCSSLPCCCRDRIGRLDVAGAGKIVE
jgi:hypothetical protein